MKLHSASTLTTLLALGSALLLTGLCRADDFTGPNGTWSSHVTGPSNAVWDVSSIPDLSVHVSVTNKETRVEIECPVDPLNQNGSGKVFGIGTNTTTLMLDDSDGVSEQTLTGAYTIKGTIVGGRGAAHGTLIQTVGGMADIDGLRKVRASSTTKFAINSVAGTISSSHIDRASAAAKGSIVNHESDGPDPLGDVFVGDGSWTLDMTLTTTSKKVTGTATITLVSGRVFHYTVKGTFNPTTEQSRLGLKGIDNAKGSVLQVRMNTHVVTLIKGKISGQAVNSVNP